jgi:Reverse transcriptase (RNA-dependent DNA polymerase)
MDTALLMVSENPTHFNFNMYTAPAIINDQKQQNPFNVSNAQLKDIIEIPSTFEEAFYHSDQWIQSQWQDAINLELNKMQDLKVWHSVNKNDIPKDRKCIKNRWVFDIKQTGVFRARLVACGYSQIPGIAFQDYYAPVVKCCVSYYYNITNNVEYACDDFRC